MPTFVTSREFNQDTSRIKRAAGIGPVFITDRGKPSHVLMTIDEYERLSGSGDSWIVRMGDAEAATIELHVERDRVAGFRPLELD